LNLYLYFFSYLYLSLKEIIFWNLKHFLTILGFKNNKAIILHIIYFFFHCKFHRSIVFLFIIKLHFPNFRINNLLKTISYITLTNLNEIIIHQIYK
jgi:hypothetical protein